MRNIYELFSDYTNKEINEMIKSLNQEDKQLLEYKYGKDLSNPIVSDKYNDDMCYDFYSRLVPKMKRILINNRINKKYKIEDFNDITLSIIDLLNRRISNNEICNILNIDSNALYKELLKIKNMGIMYSRKYYSDGLIRYKKIFKTRDYKNNNTCTQSNTIITYDDENTLKFLLISDLHLGNSLERIDLINKAFNYCIKNNINIILCGGDFIDGSFSKGSQIITNPLEQIEYLIKNYPAHNGILTFGVGGNHEISLFNENGINLADVFKNYRHDIILSGFNNASINIKNDSIFMHHYVSTGTLFSSVSPIVLHGHLHNYSDYINNDQLNICLPPLSDLTDYEPSALLLEVNFENGYIVNANIKNIAFRNKDTLLSEKTFDIQREEHNNTIKILRRF